MFTSAVLTLRNCLRYILPSSLKAVSKVITPNPTIDGLVCKQLYDQVLCLNSWPISPIQARVMSCVAAITRFALTTGLYVIYNHHPVVSFDLRCQRGIIEFTVC